MNNQKFKNRKIKDFLMINIGVLLFSLSFVFLMEPNNQVYGGVTGISIVITALLPSWTRASYFILFLNILLLLLGLIFVSKEFFMKTIYCSIAAFAFPWALEWCLTPEVLSVLRDLFQTNGFLIVTISAVVAGYGLGLALKGGASTGGTDIIQAILYKHFHMPYSKSLIFVDGSVVVAGAALLCAFGNVSVLDTVISLLYAIIYIIISGSIMDAVVFSGFNVRAVYIITKENDKVKDYIMKELERGVTIVPAIGAYTNTNREMLMTVISSREYYLLKDVVYSLDATAFVYTVRASEVHGEGFSYDSPEQESNTSN